VEEQGTDFSVFEILRRDVHIDQGLYRSDMTRIRRYDYSGFCYNERDERCMYKVHQR